MPTYVYRCEKCGDEGEVEHAMGATVTKHDKCGGPLVQVLQPVGVSFKGKGFYKTDGRGAK